ncbi:MAG TPA: hormogonium polysaccharide biosynthesis protein HpsL [Leptolyngbyaceae cyanobacterium]
MVRTTRRPRSSRQLKNAANGEVDAQPTRNRSRTKRRSRGKNIVSVQPDAPPLSRKEESALKRQATKAKRDLIQYSVFTLLVAAVVGLLLSLLVEPKIGIGALVAILCLGLSFKYPRQAIFAFIIYIPFSGTIIYSLGGSGVLQLAKDAIYLPALIGVLQFCRKNQQPFLIPQSLKLPLGLLLTLVSMTWLFVNVPQQLSSGGSGEYPVLIGVLGLKVLLGYLPLIACIYYLIRNREDLYFLLRIQVVLVLICCGLGFVQYMMLKTGVCQGTTGTGEELFKASLEARCFVGGSLLYTPSQGQIRLPGTFVAPWQWGWFLISSGFFCFGTTFSDRNPFWRLIGLISLTSVSVMAVLSGQRIALALVPLTVIGLLFLTGQVANLKRFVPVGIGLAILLSILMAQNPALVGERWASFQSRWEASPPQRFIQEQFQWAMAEQEGILGRGLGRATNSARMFGKVQLVETYHPKLLFEIGPLGLIATLALYTVLTVATYKAYRSVKDPNLRGYAASMWVFVLFISYFPYYYPLDVDPVNVYYWLAAGIALKLPAIDKQERLRQRIEEASGKRKLTPRELRQLKAQETAATFD